MADLHARITEQIPELMKCFQCGTCVSSCPAKVYSGHFSPREFILDCLNGMEKRVLDDNLWRCITCNNCNERCPQGVNPYEVIVKLKNIALREGLVSESRRAEAYGALSSLLETGSAYPLTGLVATKREEAGLQPVKQQRLRDLLDTK